MKKAVRKVVAFENILFFWFVFGFLKEAVSLLPKPPLTFIKLLSVTQLFLFNVLNVTGFIFWFSGVDLTRISENVLVGTSVKCLNDSVKKCLEKEKNPCIWG